MPYLILAVVLVITVVFISSHNELVVLRNRADEAFSELDVYFKTRHNIAKDAAKITMPFYEIESKEVLSLAVKAGKSADIKRLDNEEKLRLSLNRLFAVSQISELGKNEELSKLRSRLDSLELSLANSVKFYDSAAKAYNIKVESFPTSVVASLFNFERKIVF